MACTTRMFGRSSRPAALAARLAMVIVFTAPMCVCAAAGGQPDTSDRSAPPVQTDLSYERIRQTVGTLEYSDKTAQQLVEMVAGWKDTRGQVYFDALAKNLAYARQACTKGRMSRKQLVETELGVTQALGQCIKRGVTYKKDYFDLNHVLREKKANCFGYSQLLYILGDCIGLSVRAATVADPDRRSLASVPGHIANVVNLCDGTMVFVDLTRTSDVMSEPFMFEKGRAPAQSLRTHKDVRRLADDDVIAEVPAEGGRAAEAYIVWTQRKGDPPAAIDTKTLRILDAKQLVAEIHFSRGTVYNLAGQDQKAILHYSKAIELSPQCARAYNNRGAVYLLGKDYAAALADFDRAVEINSEFAQAYQNRGSASLGLGKHEAAIADYTAAIRLYPEFSDSFFCRGFACVQLGRYAEAIRDYSKAIELDPKSARAYYRRGIAYAHFGEDGKARNDLVKAVELDRTVVAGAARVSEDFKLGLVFN